MVRRVAVVLVLAAAPACGSKGYDEKTCAQYKDVFVKSCTDACAKSLDREVCATKCAAALPKDKDYAAKCVPSSSSSSK
jgi:hypothetical protein